MGSSIICVKSPLPLVILGKLQHHIRSGLVGHPYVRIDNHTWMVGGAWREVCRYVGGTLFFFRLHPSVHALQPLSIPFACPPPFLPLLLPFPLGRTVT